VTPADVDDEQLEEEVLEEALDEEEDM